MGGQGLLLLLGLKVLISHNDLNANHCYFGCSRLDGIKIFDKDNQVAKVCSFHLNVLWPGHFYQKLKPINTRRP